MVTAARVKSSQIACIFSEVEEYKESIQGNFLFFYSYPPRKTKVSRLDFMSVVLLLFRPLRSLLFGSSLSCFSLQLSEISPHISAQTQISTSAWVFICVLFLCFFVFGWVLFWFLVFLCFWRLSTAATAIADDLQGPGRTYHWAKSVQICCQSIFASSNKNNLTASSYT